MAKLEFTIPGRLGSWQRGRRDTRKGPGFTFTPDKMRNDQGIIRHYAEMELRRACGGALRGPLKLLVETHRTYPKSWSAKKRAANYWITSKPDFDNTLKLIADALNHVVYDDDAQIADGHHIKRYAGIDCVRVEIEELIP